MLPTSIVTLVLLLAQGALGSFTVSSGSCTTSGSCVRSPNYPSSYGNSQSCSITTSSSGYVSPSAFSTEANYDKLNFRRRGYGDYSGRRRRVFTSIYLSSGNPITWTSDYSTVSSGWEICMSPTAAPTSASGSSCTSDTCCSWGCTTYTGSCGSFETETDCWCGGYCFADSASQCCQASGGAIAGLVIGLVIGLGLCIALCVFCCLRRQKQNSATVVAHQTPAVVPQQYTPQQPQVIQPQVAQQPQMFQQMPPTVVQVMFAGGVGYRKSANYNDKLGDGPGYGAQLQGQLVQGDVQYLQVASGPQAHFLPLSTPTGEVLCSVISGHQPSAPPLPPPSYHQVQAVAATQLAPMAPMATPAQIPMPMQAVPVPPPPRPV